MSHRRNGSQNRALRRNRPRLEALEDRRLLTGDLVISEFLAVNTAGIADQDGDRSDWIEIHNTAASARNLDGWYLTDSAGDLEKWRLPNVALPADGYLLVFASGKNRATAGTELHTNFSLDGAGEYLALVEPDGVTVASEYTPTFPEQLPNVSYGIALDIDETPLIAAGSTARVLIPANGALATNWTAREFNDALWASGPTGVGYETGLPGQAAADPIAYWTLDDTNTDSSGNNYHGTLQGPSYSSDVPPMVGSGKSLLFDGTSDARVPFI